MDTTGSVIVEKPLRKAEQRKSFEADRVRGSYFICTNDGIYHLAGGKGHQITIEGRGYGLTMCGGKVVRSIDVKGASRIVASALRENLGGADFDGTWELIYEMPFLSSNGRIHQVSAGENGKLYAAMPARNSILEFGSDDGRTWTFKEFTPFTDKFGEPILADHNHINSIVQYKDFMIFVAYKVGGQSLIGLIHEKKVLGFRYPNAGMHDVYVTNSGFLCFDTFGDGKQDQGGRPITERGPSSSPLFDQPPGYVLRGAAGSGGETLFGHSHKGPRSKRFAGSGGLLHFNEPGEATYYSVPSAQIYQIVREDGRFFPYEGGVNFSRIVSQFTSVFGTPFYRGDIVVLAS